MSAFERFTSRVKGLPRIGFLTRDFTRWSSVTRTELPVPEPHGRVAHNRSTVHRFENESSVDITADAVPELNRFSPVT
jgi:hypothetical protein